MMVDGYKEHEAVKDRKLAYFLTWVMAPYTKDSKTTYEHIYYGLHPDEEESAESKKAKFKKVFNL